MLTEGSKSELNSPLTIEPERVPDLWFCYELISLKCGASLWGTCFLPVRLVRVRGLY